MPRPPASHAKRALADRHDPEGLAAFVARHLEWLRVHNASAPVADDRPPTSEQILATLAAEAREEAQDEEPADG